MIYREECKHRFRKDWDGYRRCSECRLKEEQVKDDRKYRKWLFDTEAKLGPFNAGRSLPRMKRHVPGLAHFLVLDEDGSWLACEVGGACYAPLKYMDQAAKKGKYVVDWSFVDASLKLEKGWQTEAKQTVGGMTGWASQWFTWMANESPWAPIFVTKNWKDAWKHGVIFDARVSAEQMLSAMVGIRYIGESPHVPKFFLKAREYTDNPMVALLASHHAIVSHDNLVHSGVHGGGHCMWYMNMFSFDEQLINLLEGKVFPTRNMMSRDWNWGNCATMFGPTKKLYEYPQQRPALNLPDTRGKEKQDIFGTTYITSSGMSFDQWMAEFTKEVDKWKVKALKYLSLTATPSTKECSNATAGQSQIA